MYLDTLTRADAWQSVDKSRLVAAHNEDGCDTPRLLTGTYTDAL
jgi:hypothetical protein